MKKKFCLYTDLLVKLGNLSNEDLGELFRAILSYVNGGEVSITSPAVNVAFSFVKIDLDAFQAEYEAKCRRAVENGKKGGRPKTEENLNNRVGFLENQTEPKKAERIGKDRIGKDSINTMYLSSSSYIPTMQDVDDECRRFGYLVDPKSFFHFYDDRGWMSKGQPIENWHGLLCIWDRKLREIKDNPKGYTGNDITQADLDILLERYAEVI